MQLNVCNILVVSFFMTNPGLYYYYITSSPLSLLLFDQHDKRKRPFVVVILLTHLFSRVVPNYPLISSLKKTRIQYEQLPFLFKSLPYPYPTLLPTMMQSLRLIVIVVCSLWAHDPLFAKNKTLQPMMCSCIRRLLLLLLLLLLYLNLNLRTHTHIPTHNCMPPSTRIIIKHLLLHDLGHLP